MKVSKKYEDAQQIEDGSPLNGYWDRETSQLNAETKQPKSTELSIYA